MIRETLMLKATTLPTEPQQFASFWDILTLYLQKAECIKQKAECISM